jgi:hypothetical protein
MFLCCAMSDPIYKLKSKTSVNALFLTTLKV